ncbi:hypothetical protein Acid345_2659 [Candidatus Koribacter versatilis Ellin345]|uniref:Twin-arginine translocation pathway signal n=1 Tax=Koribacter versatilis (strain Ellin345) TaxID=204669 RepID=Q1IN90_KORVE|nr:gluconate 2-dehydrogenase subunit 3 family protein [Candidatus Koribacter versatilis]ABF41660.1 hypothetical protein Acid345_2659 [Candidatus Koribacter versatilis Ellin345]
MTITRREWLLGSLSVAGWAAVASAQQHAHLAVANPESASLGFLDAATAGDVTAIAAQIVPSDDGPGATEAGAVYFFDRALTTFAAGQATDFRSGMAELSKRRLQMFPGSTSFAALTKEQQLQLLRAIEKTDFFGLLKTLTVMAWLGSPEYGGNRKSVGWKYIGFDDAGFFEPPFGYYDAEAK